MLEHPPATRGVSLCQVTLCPAGLSSCKTTTKPAQEMPRQLERKLQTQSFFEKWQKEQVLAPPARDGNGMLLPSCGERFTAQ